LVRNSSMRFSRSSGVGASQIQSTTSVIVAALFDRAWLQVNDTPFAPSGQADKPESGGFNLATFGHYSGSP
jgi:hypothetical protein